MRKHDNTSIPDRRMQTGVKCDGIRTNRCDPPATPIVPNQTPNATDKRVTTCPPPAVSGS